MMNPTPKTYTLELYRKDGTVETVKVEGVGVGFWGEANNNPQIHIAQVDKQASYVVPLSRLHACYDEEKLIWHDDKKKSLDKIN
jgi:hypothetical protein